jgi:hypothetical protein
LHGRRAADIRFACGLHSRKLWQSDADADGDSHGYSYSYCDGNCYADSYYGTASNSVTTAAANTAASPVGRSRK